MSIQIKGLEKALANYDKRAKSNIANSIVNKGAAIVEGAAKVLAPVDTGALRRSINTQQATGMTTATATVGTGIEYAIYQEFGTINQSAQPFMHPAVQQSRSKVQKLAQNEINKAMA